jgi:hypothetical protein
MHIATGGNQFQARQANSARIGSRSFQAMFMIWVLLQSIRVQLKKANYILHTHDRLLTKIPIQKPNCTTPHACRALAAAIPENSKEIIMFPGTWNWA